MRLKNKNVLIGICGGIAAYKVCELIRLLKKNEANVKVIMNKKCPKVYNSFDTANSFSEQGLYRHF